MLWAADCAEQVLPRFAEMCPYADRPRRAVEAARAWVRGEASVSEARACLRRARGRPRRR